MNRMKGLSRYIFCIVVIMAAFAVYGLRLIDWQIINGAYWLNVSTRTNTSSVKMTAARGEILDRSGNALAVNKTVYTIVFDKSAMTKDTQNKTILQLASLLEKRGETWVDELPIKVTAAGAYEFIPGRDSDVAALIKHLRLNTYATAEQCVLQMKRTTIATATPRSRRAPFSLCATIWIFLASPFPPRIPLRQVFPPTPLGSSAKTRRIFPAPPLR